MSPPDAFSEAKKRIEVAHASGQTLLDLNFLGLTDLPASLFELDQLETLYLFENRLTAVPDSIGRLVRLRKLDLGGNLISRVSKNVGRLVELRSLSLNINKIRTVPVELGSLVRLEELYLNNNYLRRVPDSLGRLIELKILWLAKNPISELPTSLSNLQSLAELDIDACRLTEVPSAVRNLTQLRDLGLAGNALTTLPAWLTDLQTLRVLRIADNPALGFPAEILGSEENKPTASELLDYYFRTHPISGEQRILREFKMILVGRGEVGKSSLVEVLQGRQFAPGKPPTEGIAITDWQINLLSGLATAHVWDFGGQEIMHGTHQFFLTHRSLYLVVLDGRGDGQNREAEYWLKHVRAFGGDSPVFVIMNKQAQHPYDTDRERLSRKYNVPLNHFIRTDCGDPVSVEKLRTALIDEANAILSFGELFSARILAAQRAVKRDESERRRLSLRRRISKSVSNGRIE